MPESSLCQVGGGTNGLPGFQKGSGWKIDSRKGKLKLSPARPIQFAHWLCVFFTSQFSLMSGIFTANCRGVEFSTEPNDVTHFLALAVALLAAMLNFLTSNKVYALISSFDIFFRFITPLRFITTWVGFPSMKNQHCFILKLRRIAARWKPSCF